MTAPQPAAEGKELKMEAQPSQPPQSLLKTLLDCACGPAREREPGIIETLFRFPDGCAVFAGHFPGNPLLPGIVQIAALACTAGRGRPLPVLRIERCKFLRLVRPEDLLSVRAEIRKITKSECHTDQKTCMKVKGLIHVGEEQCAAMTLILDSLGTV